MNCRVPSAGHRVTLSPDGRYLAVTMNQESHFFFSDAKELTTGANGWAAGSEIWILDIEENRFWRLLEEGVRSWSPAWSLDGRRLAFYSDQQGLVNLWGWEVGWGAPSLVSEEQIFGTLPSIDPPHWASDNQRIFALLRPIGWTPDMRRGVPRQQPASAPTVEVLVSEQMDSETKPGLTGLDPARSPDVGIADFISGDVRRLASEIAIHQMQPSPDGRWVMLLTDIERPDMAKFQFQGKLCLLSSSNGKSRIVAEEIGLQIGPSGGSWSPDSASFLVNKQEGFIPRPQKAGEALVNKQEWFILRPQEAREDIRLEFDRSAGQPIAWAPDGCGVIAIGPSQKQGSSSYSLNFLSLDGEAPVLLDAIENAPSILKRADSGAPCTPDGSSVVVLQSPSQEGESALWQVPLDGSPSRTLFSIDKKVQLDATADVSSDAGTIVFSLESAAEPPEFWVASNETKGAARQLSNLNPHLEDVATARVAFVDWITNSGEDARGALLLPPDGDADCPVPIVSIVYPFRMSRAGESWKDMGVIHPQVLIGRGYGVFIPDLEFGTGSEIAGWILPGINKLIMDGIAHPDRLAIIGQSFGGSTVNRLITATTRFKAAVSVSGWSDEVSGFGQVRMFPDGTPNMYGVHLAEMFFSGPPSEAPLQYVEASPVFWLHKVQTPLLLIYGVDDSATGVEQGGEMFVGLRRLGKKVTFLRYWGEGHVPSHYSEPNRRDVVDRVLAWLDEHLQKLEPRVDPFPRTP